MPSHNIVNCFNCANNSILEMLFSLFFCIRKYPDPLFDTSTIASASFLAIYLAKYLTAASPLLYCTVTPKSVPMFCNFIFHCHWYYCCLHKICLVVPHLKATVV